MTEFTEAQDELVSAYLDGEATPEEVAAVQNDPQLQQRAAELRVALEAVRTAVPAPPPDLADRAIAAAIAASDTAPNVTSLAAARSKRSPNAMRFAAAAAVVAIALLAVPLLVLNRGGDSGGDASTDVASESFGDAEDSAVESSGEEESADEATAAEPEASEEFSADEGEDAAPDEEAMEEEAMEESEEEGSAEDFAEDSEAASDEDSADAEEAEAPVEESLPAFALDPFNVPQFTIDVEPGTAVELAKATLNLDQVGAPVDPADPLVGELFATCLAAATEVDLDQTVGVGQSALDDGTNVLFVVTFDNARGFGSRVIDTESCELLASDGF